MYRNRKIIAVIPAAGSGQRMGMKTSKLLLDLGGKPVIGLTLSAFEEHPWVDELIVITGDSAVQEIAKTYSKLVKVVEGGLTRQDSIKKGIDMIGSEEAIVVIHDGARPQVSERVIREVIIAAEKFGAAIAAVEAVDTIKRTGNGEVIQTLDRNELVMVQTPQAFDLELIRKAYHQADLSGTDDATLIEKLGHSVRVVKGDYENIKVTLPKDVAYLRYLRGAKRMDYRVGIGYDVHQLAKDRKLILGGVEIPHERGLLGHSDADVLMHAIMDALLGAACLGDIGKWFSDQDEQYAGIASVFLLEEVIRMLERSGCHVVNIDATIMAQSPKLAPYIDEMRARIADVIGIESDCVNIKATTTERLGFVGREEGIAAEAIAMVDKI